MGAVYVGVLIVGPLMVGVLMVGVLMVGPLMVGVLMLGPLMDGRLMLGREGVGMLTLGREGVGMLTLGREGVGMLMLGREGVLMDGRFTEGAPIFPMMPNPKRVARVNPTTPSIPSRIHQHGWQHELLTAGSTSGPSFLLRGVVWMREAGLSMVSTTLVVVVAGAT